MRNGPRGDAVFRAPLTLPPADAAWWLEERLPAGLARWLDLEPLIPACSVEFVEERREALDRYLQALLAHEQLRRECQGLALPGVTPGWEVARSVQQGSHQAGGWLTLCNGRLNVRCCPVWRAVAHSEFAQYPHCMQTAPTCTSSCGPGPSCTSWRRRSRGRCRSSPRAGRPGAWWELSCCKDQ